MKTDKKIITYHDLEKLRKRSTKAGQKIVMTTGCYDILHLGHVLHLNFCKLQGDILLVSIGNDKTVKSLKGPSRPINDEKFRARMIAALECVNYVVISEESGIMDHTILVECLKPNIYVVPSTDSMLQEKRALVKSNGGILVTCRRLPPGHLKSGISTTQIEAKLVNTPSDKKVQI
ncbi:MAG: adenylyltransferase/cytidyltransferase family protein [Candidatus Latescibacteria bacterium]|nr:adenylyltransferase/cytidyltransferase family protein [Candidatus Latescibacterota bacterium]